MRKSNDETGIVKLLLRSHVPVHLTGHAQSTALSQFTPRGYKTPAMRAPIFNRFSPIFREYFTWWLSQMRDLLPERARTAEADASETLIVESDAGGSMLTAYMRRGDRVTTLGRFPSDPTGIDDMRNAAALGGRDIPVWLRPPAIVLEKRLAFPLAAERELGRVLAYEMDRETPFTAEEVWWNWQVDGRDKAQGQLSLTLFLLPKANGQAIVTALAESGLRPTVIDAATAGGGRHQIQLDNSPVHRIVLSGKTRTLAIACASLAVIALVAPFIRQSLALGHVESRIAELKPQVDEVQQLRRRIESSGEGANALAMEQAGSADPLKVLAEATQALPDDTHLTDLALHKHKLSLSGQSEEAAKLIGLISADPLFKNPTFTSAVTRAQGSKLDAFSIDTEVNP
jgi:general secretion pathway protein L